MSEDVVKFYLPFLVFFFSRDIPPRHPKSSSPTQRSLLPPSSPANQYSSIPFYPLFNFHDPQYFRSESFTWTSHRKERVLFILPPIRQTSFLPSSWVPSLPVSDSPAVLFGSGFFLLPAPQYFSPNYDLRGWKTDVMTIEGFPIRFFPQAPFLNSVRRFPPFCLILFFTHFISPPRFLGLTFPK